MSDQDNFFRGASLGMNAVQAGIQAQQFRANLSEKQRQFDRSYNQEERQFRTNLAEKARQFDQNYNLSELANNAAVARDIAAKNKLEFELSEQEDKANVDAIQLANMQDYTTQVREAVLNNEPIPMPYNLIGKYQEQGIAFREANVKSRATNLEYQLQAKEDEDIFDLVANHGLPRDFNQRVSQPSGFSNGGEPLGQMLVQEARARRAEKTSAALAARFGVDHIAFDEALNQRGITYIDANGDLNEEVYVAALANATGRTVDQVSKSGESYSFPRNNKLETQKLAAQMATDPNSGLFDPKAYAQALLQLGGAPKFNYKK